MPLEGALAAADPVASSHLARQLVDVRSIAADRGFLDLGPGIDGFGLRRGRIGLRLEALDVLFFRDGRPFDASARVLGGLPTPQTLAGALRTALLARHEFPCGQVRARMGPGLADVPRVLLECGAPAWVVDARFRGPGLGLDDGHGVEPLLAVPQVLARADGRWARGSPRPPADYSVPRFLPR